MALDPRTHAVRADLADLRLADRVFAPHYAAPLAMTATCDAAIREAPVADADVVGTLPEGAVFDALEMSGSHVWGQARESGVVGYVDHASLAAAAA